MLSFRSFCLAALAAVSVDATYQNMTFGNELDTGRGGVIPLAGYSDPAYLYYLDGYGFRTILLQYYAGLNFATQPTWEGCDGLCPSSKPYALMFNSSEPAGSVRLVSRQPPTKYGFDLYGMKFGCFSVGVNGTDAAGHKTIGRVPRDCQVTVAGKTNAEKPLFERFSFKATGNPQNLTQGLWTAGWRNLTVAEFQVHAPRNASFKGPVVVAVDDLMYGSYYDEF